MEGMVVEDHFLHAQVKKLFDLFDSGDAATIGNRDESFFSDLLHLLHVHARLSRVASISRITISSISFSLKILTALMGSPTYGIVFKLNGLHQSVLMHQ